MTIPLRTHWRWYNFFHYFVAVVLDEPHFICFEWPIYRHAGQKALTGSAIEVGATKTGDHRFKNYP